MCLVIPPYVGFVVSLIKTNTFIHSSQNRLFDRSEFESLALLAHLGSNICQNRIRRLSAEAWYTIAKDAR